LDCSVKGGEHRVDLAYATDFAKHIFVIPGVPPWLLVIWVNCCEQQKQQKQPDTAAEPTLLKLH
jgi:hypothetical protein